MRWKLEIDIFFEPILDFAENQQRLRVKLRETVHQAATQKLQKWTVKEFYRKFCQKLLSEQFLFNFSDNR